MSTSTLAFRVPSEIKDQLNELAKTSHRKKSDILLEWINEKLDLERWQIAETLKSIKEADAEDFATEEETLSLRRKWLS